MVTHSVENDALMGCCEACVAAAHGFPVPCHPDGEPVHGPVTPPEKTRP